MPFYCYILYSQQLDKYYIGETEDLDERLRLHNNSHFKGSFTTQSKDWKLYWSYKLNSRSEARKLEAFIKKMKSRKFIEKLRNNPQIAVDIISKLRGS